MNKKLNLLASALTLAILGSNSTYAAEQQMRSFNFFEYFSHLPGGNRPEPESLNDLLFRGLRAQTVAMEADAYTAALINQRLLNDIDQNSRFLSYIQRPENLLKIGLAAFPLLTLLFEKYFDNPNDPTKQLAEQNVEFGQIKVEQAKLALQEAKNEAKAKDTMRKIAIQHNILQIEEQKDELLKNRKMVELSAKLTQLAEKKSGGQELTESEQESYNTYQKILDVLARVNARSAAQEAPGAA